LIPLGIVSAAGAGVTAVPTKIVLSSQVTSYEYYPSLDAYGTPVVSNYSAFPGDNNNISINSPYELFSVTLTATLTSGLDEDYYSNPVVGQSVYFNIGGTIFGQSSLSEDPPSSSTMITDSNGQISKTFNPPQWIPYLNGDNIVAIFDGNIEGTLSASQSGNMTITEYGAA
jgi:hypothetical protein